MKNLLLLSALCFALIGCGSSDETATEKPLQGKVEATEKPNDGGEAAAHAQREENLKRSGGAAPVAGDQDKEMSGM